MDGLRTTWRMLRKQGQFLWTAVATLALGVALVATQYSLIDGVLLRPLPFAEGERIWHVAREGAPGTGGWSAVDIHELLAQREAQTSFEKLAIFSPGIYNLISEGAPPERLWGSEVSVEFFEILRVQPILGRSFVQGEDASGAPLRALIAASVWRDRFGSDPAVIGRSIRLNGENALVIGVMPEGFKFPSTESVWVNLRPPPAGAAAAPGPGYQGLGLLARGVDPQTAAAQLELAARQYRSSLGRPVDDVEPMRVERLQYSYNGGGTASLLATMLAMTVFVLLLACLNVANLLYVRATDRSRDLALHSALGAARAQLLRQLLTESAIIGALGAVGGVILAAMGVQWLQWQIHSRIDMAGWAQFELNPQVLAVAIGAALGAGLLAGLLPAWRASRVDVAAILAAQARGGVGGDGRVRRWLVAGQLAFACTALIVAVLMALSASRSADVALAYDPDSLLIGRLELQGPAYAEEEAKVRFYNQLVAAVETAPGVAAAAVSSRDLVDSGVLTPVQQEGVVYARAQEMDDAWLEVVSRDYFKVIERTAIRGRVFDASDRRDSMPVAVVNQRFVEHFYQGREAIGQRIRDGRGEEAWATIIGVVPDFVMQGLGSSIDGAGYYLLQDQQGWGWLELLVRGEPGVDMAALAASVRAAVAALDPEQPVHAIRSLRERSDRRLAGLDILSSMAMVFAGAALLLAGIGVYGVVAYNARRRTREMGLRRALGASGGGIVGLLFRQSALVAAVGIALGIIAGYALSQPLAPILPLVSADDPWLYLGVGLLMTLTTLLACWMPSRQAAAVDPMVALRSE